MANQPSREQQIFIAALQLATREERAAYLKDACASDAALRQRVEALLLQHDQAGNTLDPDVTVKSAPSPNVPPLGPLTEKPGDRIGRYKLLQEIGEGGCGVVYMAEQQEPVRRRVALKIIKLGMDTKQVVARFEAERQALALMDHPNIAKVLDAGATETGRPYFVMELVRGVPITDYCDQHKLTMPERLELFIQVCKAIQHAHQKGIIHRDIKPSNILVTLNDGVPVPKVIDFGIAKAIDQPLTEKTLFTRFEQFIGTPAYMSPEQAEMSALDIDTRSDIYALGVLLYELLTGKTPFDAKRLVEAGIDEIRRIIREEEPLRPSTRISTLDVAEQTTVASSRQSEPPQLIHLVRGDLDWIVMQCLEKDRTRRYETANGLAADIARFLNDEPVVARQPTNAYRFQKFVRRNKLAVAATSVVFAALTVGLGVSAWMFLKEKEARLRADAAEKAQRQLHQEAEAALAEAQANFHLARKSIQNVVVGAGDAANWQQKREEWFTTFLDMYRKARATQPIDRELLSEYCQLLAAKSQSRRIGNTSTLPQDAETNLDEAIALLERPGSDQELSAEERFLLAQICQQRVEVWRQRQRPNADEKNVLVLPASIEALAERSRSLSEQLVKDSPDEARYVSLYLQSVQAISQIESNLPLIEKILEHQPQNEDAIRSAQLAHWGLGKAVTNSTSEASGHYREVLALQTRLMRAPGFHLNQSRQSNVAGVITISASTALLLSSDAVDADLAVMTNLLSVAEADLMVMTDLVSAAKADLTVMTNLLSAPEVVTLWEGNSVPSYMGFDSVGRNSDAPTLGALRIDALLTFLLPTEISFHLMAHGRYEEVISFANHQLLAFDVIEQKFKPLFDRAIPAVRDRFQVAAATAAIHLGRPAEAIPRLEPLAGAEMLDLVRSGEAQSRVLGLRHLAAATLDEAYVLQKREDQARQSLNEWLDRFDRQFGEYGGLASMHHAFDLCRLAAIEAAAGQPEAATRSHDKAFQALEQVSDYRLRTLAELLAEAAGNSRSDRRRAVFAEAAVFALNKCAALGAYKSDSVRSDLYLQSLAKLPEIRPVLASFDQAAHAVDQRLALDKPIDVSDHMTLVQAALRRAKVRVSGRIAWVTAFSGGYTIYFVGADTGFWAQGMYENGAPRLMSPKEDLSDLAGGVLVLSGIPGVDDRRPGKSQIYLALSRDDQIVSFSSNQDSTASSAMNVIVPVVNVTTNDLGKHLKVEGTVQRFGQWSSVGGFYVTFMGVQKDGLGAVLPASQKAALDDLFPPASNNFVGSTIRLAGVVEIWGGKPLIPISDVRRIEVVKLMEVIKSIQGYRILNDEVVFDFDPRVFLMQVDSNAEVMVAGEFNHWLDNDGGKITNSYPQWVMQRVDENHYALRKKIADFRERPQWQFKFVVNKSHWIEVPETAQNRGELDGMPNLMLMIPQSTTNTSPSQN